MYDTKLRIGKEPKPFQMANLKEINHSTTMKTSHFLLPFLCMCLLFTLSHCTTDDSDDMDAEIDLSDANALTEAIVVNGATEVGGDPPAPSSDPNAPEIEDPGDEVSVQGGELNLELPVISGTVAGVYLQIPGADSYFDIPASALAGGRIAQDYEQFSIELPDNIQPGTFCVEYCVYDSENLVSNIVTVCIEVGELGGANSDFLIGVWNITKLVFEEGGTTRTQTIGEPFTETFTETLVCADGQTTDQVEIEETEDIEFIRITFSENGALRFEESGEETEADLSTSTCESVVYNTRPYSDDFTGAWSYEEENDRLVLIINEVDDGKEDQNVIDFSISLDGDTMTAVLEVEGETTTATLVKQQ